jgi:uncharacterized RDD family membrane protein YckC
MDNNLYAPSKAALNEPATERGAGVAQEIASRGQRFGNYLVDQFACFGLSTGLVLVTDVHSGLVIGANPLKNYLVGGVVRLAYYITCEATVGRTLGKLITGTRVVGESGDKPSFAQIVGRSFSRMVPFEGLSFLGDWPGWHDRWSQTRVVRTR